MRDYNKPPLSYSEQLELLVNRGLIIDNPVEAESFLSHVNYYRLSAYCLPFESKRHEFIPNANFTNIKQLYEFDRILRALLDEALEIIEISLRAGIAYYLVHAYDSFFHESPDNFYESKRFSHSAWKKKLHEEIRRSRETFIKHYQKEYNGFPVLPLWMAVEVMSFGSLSLLFQNLFRKDQKAISKKYKLHTSVFTSWLHTFSYVRNICAHHGRLWNRKLAIGLVLPKSTDWEGHDRKSITSVIFAIMHFMKVLSIQHDENESWGNRLKVLLEGQKPFPFENTEYDKLRSIVNSPLWVS